MFPDVPTCIRYERNEEAGVMKNERRIEYDGVRHV